MNCRLNNSLFRNLKGGIMLAIAGMIMGWSIAGQAQSSFTANGRKINIKSLNQEVEKMLSEVGVPGLSFAVIDNNKVVFSKNYGYKLLEDSSKVDEETIFEAASLSKSFLLLAAYKMVDEGKLELDKPLYEYAEHERLEHDPRYKKITARMVLSHSSGIENWQSNHNPDTLEILADPGTAYVYSGEGYNYLAGIMAQLLDQSIEEYMKSMVYEPLGLKRTYSVYKDEGKSPANHAYGHNEFGEAWDKWKNENPVPSSGINTRAGDYAQLIAALFNGKHLSKDRVNDMKQAIVRIGDEDSKLFYGPGFEILYTNNDTLIFQGGSNPGWKGQLCYSITNKRGIVIMTNGDRGKLMTNKLCELTAGIDISMYFEGDVFTQYPSVATELFNVYRTKGGEAMVTRMEKIVKEKQTGIGEPALNELAYMFRAHDPEIAKRVASENIKLFPEEPNAYWILGKLYYGAEEYQLALDHLKKAKALQFQDQAWIDYDIQQLQAKLEE